jgi:phenylalanyl-tRNA synthetase beta chain
MGFSEAVTVSLVEEERARAWHAALGHPDLAVVRLTNPLSEGLSTMRPHILPGLVASVALNLNRRRRDPRFFEVGDTFTVNAGDPRPQERWHLALALSGAARDPSWDDPPRAVDFYDLRGVVEAYHQVLGIAAPEFRPVSWPLFGAEAGAEILIEGEPLGFMGELSAGFLRDWGLRQETLVLEIDLERLAATVAGIRRRHRDLPRFPALERDVAVVVDRDVPHARVERLIREEGGGLLESTRLFDCYVGEPLPQGKKSLAYSITLRAAERTLTEEEAGGVRRRIAERVARELGATLRE